MINDTEKIWGIPASTIHPDWARQRIQGLNLWSVCKDIVTRTLRGSTRSNRSTPKSLVDTFCYPQFGTGRIYEAIHQHLLASGTPVATGSEPITVEHGQGPSARPRDAILRGVDHSLEMCVVASRMILEGRTYDIDPIGAESEYVEKGPIYERRS